MSIADRILKQRNKTTASPTQWPKDLQIEILQFRAPSPNADIFKEELEDPELADLGALPGTQQIIMRLPKDLTIQNANDALSTVAGFRSISQEPFFNGTAIAASFVNLFDDESLRAYQNYAQKGQNQEYADTIKAIAQRQQDLAERTGIKDFETLTLASIIAGFTATGALDQDDATLVLRNNAERLGQHFTPFEASEVICEIRDSMREEIAELKAPAGRGR